MPSATRVAYTKEKKKTVRGFFSRIIIKCPTPPDSLWLVALSRIVIAHHFERGLAEGEFPDALCAAPANLVALK